jgi:hypothetical protein
VCPSDNAFSKTMSIMNSFIMDIGRTHQVILGNGWVHPREPEPPRNAHVQGEVINYTPCTSGDGMLWLRCHLVGIPRWNGVLSRSTVDRKIQGKDALSMQADEPTC